MNFSERPTDARRKGVGLALVVLLHATLFYALATGLAQRAVDTVLRTPVETRVIAEIRKPPPVPVVQPPPPLPQKSAVPRTPPPQVNAAPPPLPLLQPSTRVATPAPPVAPEAPVAPTPVPTPMVAPLPSPAPAPAPPTVAAAPVVAKPSGPVQAGTVCTRMPPPEPPGISAEVQGSLFVIATLKAGRVVQVEIERNTLKGVPDRRVMRQFISAVESTLKDGYLCNGDGVQVRQEFYFDIK